MCVCVGGGGGGVGGGVGGRGGGRSGYSAPFLNLCIANLDQLGRDQQRRRLLNFNFRSFLFLLV